MTDLRDTLKRVLPSWISQPLRSVFFALFRRPPVRLTPVADLFPKLEKEVLAPPLRVETPELRSMSLHERASHLHRSQYCTPEDYFAVLPNVLFCPTNNVVLTEGKQVVFETVNTGRAENLDLRALYTARRGRVSGYGTPLRSLYNNHYHTLVDSIPRLLTLRTPALSDVPIQLLHSGALTTVEAFLLGRVLPSNVSVHRLPEGRLYEIEHLVLSPFKTQRFSGYLPPYTVATLRTLLLPKRPPGRRRRLLLSRRHAHVRRLDNHDQLEERLAPFGFETVRPETLEPAAQVDLFYDAEVVVAPHGAGLANLIFAPEGTKVLELFPTPYVTPHYYFLAKSLGHHYAHVEGRAATRDPASFEADVPAVEQRLRDWSLGTSRRHPERALPTEASALHPDPTPSTNNRY